MNQARSTLAFAEFCKASELTAQETVVLAERLGWNGDPKTYVDIGASFGLTGSRIRQIECKALRKTQRRVEKHGHFLDKLHEAIDLPEFFTSPITTVTVQKTEIKKLKRRAQRLKTQIKELEELKKNFLTSRIADKHGAVHCVAERLIRMADEMSEQGQKVKMILISPEDARTLPNAFRHHEYHFVHSKAIVPGKGIVVCRPDKSHNENGWMPIKL